MLAKVQAALAAMPTRILPDDRGASPLFCITLLVAACASASLVFTCATPFAAFAVLAAATLPLASALGAISVLWLVNQVIGYGLLGYPWSVTSVLLGVAIGAAAAFATISAALVFHRLTRDLRLTAYPVALVASLAAYELCLFAAMLLLGVDVGFAPDVVGRIALLNAVWLAGLAAVYMVAGHIKAAAQGGAL